MEQTSTKKEGSVFELLNDDVVRLILDGLYEVCLHDFDGLEARAKQIKAAKKILPLGYTSRSFAKLVLPYVWQYARVVINSRSSHNFEIFEILKKDNLLFPYGDYLKELEINFTVCSGDERYRKTPNILPLLQVVADRCTSIQQLNFLAKVEHRNTNEHLNFLAVAEHRNIKEHSTRPIYDESTINQEFQRVIHKTEWSNFKDLVASAFGQGSLVDVSLSSNFILMDDECLINITQNNPGIRKLTLTGSQFTHRGMETALQYLGGSLKELEIYNLLRDGKKTSPLSICIDSLLKPCRNLQSIHLAGIKYRPTDKLEDYFCPLKSITANQVDEETLHHLFLLVNKQTLFQVKITNPYDSVKWDPFLRSSILPCASAGSLENLILFMLRCQNHKYSSRALDPNIIMKNVMKTLQVSSDTVDLLCSKLKQWRIFVGKDTVDQLYSVEAEAVDFVSRTCILDYDRLALSEYY